MTEPITSQPIRNTINSIDPNNEENLIQTGQTENQVKEQITNDNGCYKSFFCCCNRKTCLNCQNVDDDYESDIDDDYEPDIYDEYDPNVNDNFESNVNNGCESNVNDYCLQNLDAGFYGRNDNSNICDNIEPERTTVAVDHNYCTENYESHNNYASNDNDYNYASNDNDYNYSSYDNNDYATYYDAGDSGGGDYGGSDD